MASSTQTGAVYGVGTYGTDQYGIANISIAVDGVQAVGTTDPDIVITADANHVITSVQGVSANGGVGQVIGNAVEEPTGVQATGTVDTVNVAHNARPTFDGVEGTGSVGTVTTTADSNVGVTTPSVISTGVDQAIVVADSNFEVSGVEGTTSVGTPTQVTVNRVPVTGVEGTGEIGDPVIGNNAIPALIDSDTVVSTGSIGTVSTTAAAVPEPTGVSTTGAVGTSTIVAGAILELSQVTGTSQHENVTVSETQNVFNVANRSAIRVTAKVPPSPPRIVYVGRAA